RRHARLGQAPGERGLHRRPPASARRLRHLLAVARALAAGQDRQPRRLLQLADAQRHLLALDASGAAQLVLQAEARRSAAVAGTAMSAESSARARTFTGRKSRATMKREKSSRSEVQSILSGGSGWRSSSQRSPWRLAAEGSIASDTRRKLDDASAARSTSRN